MLDGVKQKITRLIADFEAERAERKRLQIELEKMATRNEAYKKQILELEREIDNRKLKGAFLCFCSPRPEEKQTVPDFQADSSAFLHKYRERRCPSQQALCL